MALRPLDNALPIASERPKKQAKIKATAAVTASKERELPDISINDENKVPAEASIDYIPSENLEAFPDPAVKIQGLIGGLESKDWLKVCESLNDLRRFAIHHPNLLHPILNKVVLVIVKAMKNPRSALCKTSIMAAADIFKAYGEKLLESASETFNQLLLQLLLKASQDKKFVCEEADKALSLMVNSTTPLSLLHKLSAYVSHSNLRVRAKAAVSISNCVSKMDLKGIEEYGVVELMKIAGNLLNDKLPEAREAARGMVIAIYEKRTEGVEDNKMESWQGFCLAHLPAIHAQAMVKIISSSTTS